MIEKIVAGGRKGFFAIILLGLAFNAKAEVAIVASPLAPVDTLTRQEAADIYLGKVKLLSTGLLVRVVDLPIGNVVRDEFYSKLTNKNPIQVKAHRSKLIFSGGSVPHVLLSGKAVKKWVRRSPGHIGYIDGGSVDDTVKVLLRLP